MYHEHSRDFDMNNLHLDQLMILDPNIVVYAAVKMKFLQAKEKKVQLLAISSYKAYLIEFTCFHVSITALLSCLKKISC